ncbi:MAG: 2-(1,2-epoxy-1,2-dihydrophenyl)acetyl-CoA isomerase [Rhizobiales bacterium]|nr:2-(1,2-epoxy-1,2-dihydrophenyl)acetyl-CoA isomerase [Hyphomicrobiales bacterium]
MPFATIRCETHAGVTTVTLTRPERLNAITAAMHAELRKALDACAAEPAVRCLVLTGTGRAFSSGQDLTEDLPRDAEGRPDLGRALDRDYNPLIRRLVDFPKVTIAALNGPAVGAAANIALACDIVVAARSAYLQEAFAQIALVPDAGGTWLLPRIVGMKRAMALMLTADPVPAEEAERMGLVYKVFDDARFPEEAAALAQRLAAGPAATLRMIKRALRASAGNDLDAQLALERELQLEAGRSRDFIEGVTAFREKRRPKFDGR